MSTDAQGVGESLPGPRSPAGAMAQGSNKPREENEAASMPEASSDSVDNVKSLRMVSATIIIPIIAAMIAMAALIVSPLNSRFDSIDSRFAQIDQRFAQIDEKIARLETKIDANSQKILEIESKLDRIADMTILAHGNGEITSDELALIWETAGRE